MKDTEVLQNCRMLLWEVKLLSQQTKNLEAALGPRRAAVQSSWEQPRRTNEQEAACLQHLSELERRMLERRTYLTRLLLRLEELVNTVEDPRVRQILRMYYEQGWCDRQVAEKLSLSPRTVNRLRNAFIRSLQGREAA